MNRNDAYKRSKLFWENELMSVGTTFIALVGLYYVFLVVNIKYIILH